MALVAAYEYDVFISYRQTGSLPDWLFNHFYPNLLNLLNDNLDYPVSVFVDKNVRGGVEWPLELESALLRTRILVPVCSAQYFQSRWCLAEWESMARREELLGLRSAEQPQGLIYPVLFADSETFPDFARNRQMRNLKRWNCPHPSFQQTVRYVEFHDELAKIAIELTELIRRAPEWRPGWPVDRPVPALLPPTQLPRLGR
ncbi:TIR domain-containing protein [Actinokineospora sp. UTMC 2448]|uniref:TIR domain-containing protein n=1 Tax=Actinokineospora sp. UTMC 2448 TaxID=2268449 RepID=UPI00216417C5|nr:TIR domain-containing protein [Actinokineospora sp. UTMC 2448]UVS78434.1 TIR domain protein [Actinokineospora sp. UTMC 2448]